VLVCEFGVCARRRRDGGARLTPPVLSIANVAGSSSRRGMKGVGVGVGGGGGDGDEGWEGEW